MADVTIYTDGAARNNPGPSASGFVVYEGKKVLHEHCEYNGRATNNYAEYKAVLLALKWCGANLDADESTIELYCDNELVVKQLNGQYKLKSDLLRPLNREINDIVKHFREVKFGNVRRNNEHISAVDKALNVLLDRKQEI